VVNTREIAQEYRLTHWAGIMRERAEIGLNIKAYCRQIGISTNTYHYWQRKLRESACEQLSVVQERSVAFAEVELSGPAHQLPSSPALVESCATLQIEVSGIKLTVDSSYPIDKLTALVRELG